MKKWTAADILNQRGKLAIVTGANSGVGFHVAMELARAGAKVVLACRNRRKGEQALREIRAEVPRANVALGLLDLADLKSIHAFAEQIVHEKHAVSLLVNNAGVMALPQREVTADGFEMQFGVNHLGHFALTGLLMPTLLRAEGARVVAVSSLAHSITSLNFSDLQAEHSYWPFMAYGQSKLANLLFATELQVRSDEAGCTMLSVAAHPGLSETGLVANGPGSSGASLLGTLLSVGNRVFTQSAAQGALPILYAATSPDVQPAGFYGPDGFGEFWGYPKPAWMAPHARERKSAVELWQISERLTGVRYFRAAKFARQV